MRCGTLRGAALSTTSGDFERQVGSQLDTDGREAEAGNGQWIALYKSGPAYQVLDNRTLMAVWRDAVTIAEPINSKFRRLPEGQAPQRAEHYRTLWRRFHAVRNLAALAALACLAAAAV